MAKSAYVGVDGIARKIKKMYVGVDSKARKVKKGYIGVGGVARPFFSGEQKLEYYGTITALSSTRYSLAGASVGDYALFAGGFKHRSDTSTSIALSSVNAYDSSLVRSTPTSLSKGQYGLAGASVGNYALFAGGIYRLGSSTNRLSTVDAYDSSLVRSTPTGLSSTRYNFAGASVGDYALFAGGDNYSSVIDAYDSSLVKSTPTGLSSLSAQPGLAGASVGDYAIFAGGGSGNGKKVDAYDSSLVRSTPTGLSSTRHNLAGASVGDYALFAGGENHHSNGNGTGYDYSLSTVDAYDSSLVRSTPTELSKARASLAGASVGNYALFAGGDPMTSDYTYSNTVDAYVVY